MKTILQFFIPWGDVAVLRMPEDAWVLTVQRMGPNCCIWVLADPLRPRVERHFRVVTTGSPVDVDPKGYIGTVQTHQDSLNSVAWHIFEVSAP